MKGRSAISKRASPEAKLTPRQRDFLDRFDQACMGAAREEAHHRKDLDRRVVETIKFAREIEQDDDLWLAFSDRSRWRRRHQKPKIQIQDALRFALIAVLGGSKAPSRVFRAIEPWHQDPALSPADILTKVREAGGYQEAARQHKKLGPANGQSTVARRPGSHTIVLERSTIAVDLFARCQSSDQLLLRLKVVQSKGSRTVARLLHAQEFVGRAVEPLAAPSIRAVSGLRSELASPARRPKAVGTSSVASRRLDLRANFSERLHAR